MANRMISPPQLAEEILVGLKAIQDESPEPLSRGDDFKLPRLIPAGAVGSHIRISKEIDEPILRLGWSTYDRRRPSRG
jgi:hypothetical protein